MGKEQRAFFEEYCQKSARYFEVRDQDWSSMSDEKLMEEVEWFDHLWEK
jgi:hypothetical protein